MAGGSSSDSFTFVYHYPFASKSLPSGIILDDGCGQGTGTMLLARPDRSIIALDTDPRAIRRALRLKRPKTITFQLQRDNRIPLPSNSVDGAVSFEVIEHMGSEDQKQYISELFRVLKPGATVILSTPNRRVMEPF